MITYDKLKKKPRVFKSITGVTRTEFDDLYKKFCSTWAKAERMRLNRSDRQRAVGGGHPYTLTLQQMLLMNLVWLRLYLSMEALGFFFGIDKGTVSRNTRRVLPVLHQIGDASLSWLEPPKRCEGKSVEQALLNNPDLLAIIDATEQLIEQPRDST
jgi:hypothetical protein